MKTKTVSDLATNGDMKFSSLSMSPAAEQIIEMKRSVESVMPKKSAVIPIIATVFGVSGYMAVMISATLFQWMVIAVGVLFVIVVGAFFVRWTSERLAMRNARQGLIFENFANDNDMNYSMLVERPEYPGVIFQSGESRRIRDRLCSNDDEFEVGNYEYTVHHGKTRTTYVYGYFRIKLKRKVAHMLLDSKQNNMNIFGKSFSNLPISMSHDQILSLEGDFDNYFTLYAPAEYERDALYVFTPDLMAQLIDVIAEYDAEVIDDQLYIYGPEFDLLDESVWRKLIAIKESVGKRTIDRTDYYADEKVGNRVLNIIATPGERLRRGLPWKAIAITVAFIAMIVFQMLIRSS